MNEWYKNYKNIKYNICGIKIHAYYQIIDSKHRFEEGIQGIYITKVADAQGELDNDKKESVEIK